MSNCIFCDIVSGTAPASVVYEDSNIIAFMDIQPIIPGHTLIIPKKHCVYLSELDDTTGAQLFRVTREIVRAVRDCGIRCEGANLFLADGEAVGQDVFHTHMHVIPRYKGDNFVIKPEYPPKPGREELDRLASSIKDSFSI